MQNPWHSACPVGRACSSVGINPIHYSYDSLGTLCVKPRNTCPVHTHYLFESSHQTYEVFTPILLLGKQA